MAAGVGDTVLSVVSVVSLISDIRELSWSEWRRAGHKWLWPGLAQVSPEWPQSGEHQCLSVVASVKVTQKNISCCEVPGCCLSISQPIEFRDTDTLTTIC